MDISTQPTGTTTTEPPRPKPEPAAGGRGRRGGGRRRGPFARISLLYREVVGELRKVIWPSRRELVGYTSVVLVFVVVMVGLVALLDLGFVRVFGSRWLFV